MSRRGNEVKKGFSMKVTLMLFLISLVSFSAQARKPAVEDFVGVEPENYQKTPEGTQVLFDFKKELSAKDFSSKEQPLFGSVSSNSSLGAYGLALFITLPFLMWFGLTRNVRGNNPLQLKEEPAQQEFKFESKMASSENIAKLEDYRKKEDKDSEKKAS